MTETIQQTTKQVSHFDLVYKDAFKHLVNKFEAFYDDHVSRDLITHKLLDYTFTMGKEALIDIHAYLQHAEINNWAYPYYDVNNDIDHAGNEGHKRRTAGYAVQMYGEGFIDYKFK